MESLALLDGVVDIYLPDFVADGDDLARRGLLVRHLVMPGALDDTARILDGAVLCQPEARDRYAQHARPSTIAEHRRALELAREAGLTRIDERRSHPRLRARLPLLP